MKSFNILGSVNPPLTNEPLMINIHLIDADDKNFFTEDVKEESKRIKALSEEIMEVGFHSIIEVQPTRDRYKIIAGETRFKAMKYAYEQTHDAQYQFIPCFINRDENPITLRRRLIMDNALQRDLTPALKLRMVEELQKTYELEKANGKELPGRIQYLIAKDMNIEKSQVGTYQKIIKNASDSVKDKLQNDEITLDAASKLSSMSTDQQDKLIDETKGMKVNSKKIDDLLLEAANELSEDDDEQLCIDDYLDEGSDEEDFDEFTQASVDKMNLDTSPQSLSIKDKEILRSISDQFDLHMELNQARTRIQTISNTRVANMIEVKFEELQDTLDDLIQLISTHS